MKKYTIILILVFYGAVVCAQNDADNTIVKKIPFKLVNNHIYLEVRVNGSKPLWFLLDTGAGDIIDLERAKELDLKLHSFGQTDGVGNALQEFAMTNNVLFQIGDASFTEEKTAVVALKSVEECANKIAVDTLGKVTMQENAIGNKQPYQPIDGVLGSGFFKTFVVEINYKQKLLTLYDPKIYHYQGNGKIAPIDIRGHHIFTNASVKVSGAATINGSFLVDTGSMLAVMLTAPFIEKNDLLPPPSQTTPLSLCGIGGNSEAQMGTIPGLFIQQIEINKPPTVFSQATGGTLSSTEYDGNIGNAILRHFNVIFDYSKRQLILE